VLFVAIVEHRATFLAQEMGITRVLAAETYFNFWTFFHHNLFKRLRRS